MRTYIKQTLEERLDSRFAARERRDEKAFEKRQQREEKAALLIGELCRGGRTVFYANLPNWRVKESYDRQALVDFLIRNNYA